MRRDWKDIGREHWEKKEDKKKIEKAIADMEWQKTKVGMDLSMMAGEAIKTAIQQFRIPRVEAIAISNEMAPYGLYGIRALYAGGQQNVWIYLLDLGDTLTPLCADLYDERDEATMSLSLYLSRLEERGRRISSHGNEIIDYTYPGWDGSRYPFDSRFCNPLEGWEQFDTNQDAEYFGTWINKRHRMTFTYCEGDLMWVRCRTADDFNLEVTGMCQCYSPGRAFAAIETETGVMTEYFEDRRQHFISLLAA